MKVKNANKGIIDGRIVFAKFTVESYKENGSASVWACQKDQRRGPKHDKMPSSASSLPFY
jgi:hypothetical protein